MPIAKKGFNIEANCLQRAAQYTAIKQKRGTTEGAIQLISTRLWKLSRKYIRNNGAPMLNKNN